MSESVRAWTKRRFNARKAVLESKGWKVTNRWRKGCKAIKLEPIVLGERACRHEWGEPIRQSRPTCTICGAQAETLWVPGRFRDAVETPSALQLGTPRELTKSG